MLALPWTSFARLTNAPPLQAGQIGHLEQGKNLVGADLKSAQNQAVGKIVDAVVDLESGRILYTIATINGLTDRIALPPETLTGGAANARTGLLGAVTDAVTGAAKTHIVNVDQAKLTTAPKFTADRETQLGDVTFLSQVYQFFGTPAWWQGAAGGQPQAGSFNNVQKVTGLYNRPVKDAANADLGKIDDVVLDLHDARVPYVLLMGQQNAEYAVPPNAFTLSADKQTLVSGIDQNTLTSAPRFTKGNLQMLANQSTATAIYQHFGKQTYFGAAAGGAPSTGAGVSTGAGASTGLGASTNTSTNAMRFRRGQFIGQLEEGRKLIGAQINNAQNQPLGKIEDAVVDLESGRILFTVASINGLPDRIALPAESFTVQGSPAQGAMATHMLNVDREKLNTAPKFSADRESQLGNVSFVSEVYRFYGTPAWFEGAGAGQAQPAATFNNAQKVSALFDHPIKDASNADLGKIDDVILDLQAARLPFVVLMGQQAGAEYAIPPNAITLSADKQTLTSGVDQNTLNSAPRFTKGNVRMLANRGTAMAIYRHFGKQPYFSEGLSPTSERTNVPPYVYPGK